METLSAGRRRTLFLRLGLAVLMCLATAHSPYPVESSTGITLAGHDGAGAGQYITTFAPQGPQVATLVGEELPDDDPPDEGGDPEPESDDDVSAVV